MAVMGWDRPAEAGRPSRGDYRSLADPAAPELAVLRR